MKNSAPRKTEIQKGTMGEEGTKRPFNPLNDWEMAQSGYL